jgi:molybdate transport system substrate-binding protein
MLARYLLALGSLLLFAPRPLPAADPPLTVAAAANLSEVFELVKQEFTRQTGIPVTLSFSSTLQLTQQIENGAPFDLFAAADREHIDKLKQEGLLAPSSDALYALGHLVLWCTAKPNPVHSLADLTSPAVRYVAIAKPETAPYGLAAQQALQAAGLWKSLSPKIVYGENINLVRQYVSSGNADCGFVARSLVMHETEGIMPVDEKLYHPIEQWLGIVRDSPRQSQATRFKEFLLGPAGRGILEKNGYSLPRKP